MKEQEVKALLFKVFVQFMSGNTMHANEDGETIYPERDVHRFCAIAARATGSNWTGS